VDAVTDGAQLARKDLGLAHQGIEDDVLLALRSGTYCEF
jgi:hypothetical protein